MTCRCSLKVAVCLLVCWKTEKVTGSILGRIICFFRGQLARTLSLIELGFAIYFLLLAAKVNSAVLLVNCLTHQTHSYFFDSQVSRTVALPTVCRSKARSASYSAERGHIALIISSLFFILANKLRNYPHHLLQDFSFVYC